MPRNKQNIEGTEASKVVPQPLSFPHELSDPLTSYEEPSSSSTTQSHLAIDYSDEMGNSEGDPIIYVGKGHWDMLSDIQRLTSSLRPIPYRLALGDIIDLSLVTKWMPRERGMCWRRWTS